MSSIGPAQECVVEKHVVLMVITFHNRTPN